MKKVADNKLRCLLAYNKSFFCTDVHVGASGLLCEASNRKSAPQWRGPAKILNVVDAGVAAKSQRLSGNTRYCVRKKADVRDVGEVDWSPASSRSDTVDSMLPVALGSTKGGDRLFSQRGGGPNESSAASPRG